jgi:acyl-coenzyme A thioesterase 9
VSRDANNYKLKKKVPKLIPGEDMTESEVEKLKLRYELGEENKDQRIMASKINLSLNPPSVEESHYLHSIFKDHKENPGKYKPMIETRMEKNLLLQSQSQNIHGKLFGGYIMRIALELGFVTAYMHSGCKHSPELICVDRVNFWKPAEIGSVGLFQAMICFVYENLIHINVECYNYKGNEKLLTTTLDLTYFSENKNQLVIPTLYENGAKFLEGKRKMENLFL